MGDFKMVQTSIGEEEFFARVGMFGLNKIHVGFLDDGGEIKTLCGRSQFTGGGGRKKLYKAEDESAPTCQVCKYVLQQRGEGES